MVSCLGFWRVPVAGAPGRCGGTRRLCACARAGGACHPPGLGEAECSPAGRQARQPCVELHPTAQLQLPNCPINKRPDLVLATQEANYAHQQELDMIPLLMQKDYSPKGYVRNYSRPCTLRKRVENVRATWPVGQLLV